MLSKHCERYFSTLYTGTTDFVKTVKEIANESVASNIEGDSFTSKAYKGSFIEITIATGGKVTCKVTSKVTGVDDIVID